MKERSRLRLRSERLTELAPADLAAIAGGQAPPKTITTCISQLMTNTWSCSGPPDTHLCAAVA
jgi:hypothetical protein